MVLLSIVVLFTACTSQTGSSPRLPGDAVHNKDKDAQNNTPSTSGNDSGGGDNMHVGQQPTPPPIVVQGHEPAPVSTPQITPTSTISGTPPPTSATPTNIPITGTGAAPYGSPPPLTAEEIQLTQKLFAKINSDRAASGLYPFQWNGTLSGGARLHSWNMYHCGFSHTCPDGTQQCDRIATEGFAGYTDCGENIGYAGPFPTAWEGTAKIQQTMVNEPPTGWHRIHLFSKTLNHVGVGVYVDPDGYIWFTEDMVS
jgi:uncharacterized protein YkwD